MVSEMKIKILDERVRAWGLPAYQTAKSAGLDLYACVKSPMTIYPQAPAELIPTGIAVDMDEPMVCGMIYPRSGLGHKKGLVLGNGTGVIDADYQGEIFVSAWNRNPDGDGIEVKPGDRIAQLVFLPVIQPSFREVADFDQKSRRGSGGFGSTGT